MKKSTAISRREFLHLSGAIAIGAWAGSYISARLFPPEALAVIPASSGYLLVDTKKCQGCMSCMIVCSLVHEGEANPSLARIQVIQSPFACWPSDLTIEQCRQCVEAACVAACPQGAIVADKRYGYVRIVHSKRCNGCGACQQACPFIPSRVFLHHHPKSEVAKKCDLCAEAPYRWFQNGGAAGRQACVEVCPVGAISFTSEIPPQQGEVGYKVNLRDERWSALGYPKDD